MPKYELCYILSSQVSDDQVPQVSEDIQKIVSSYGAENLEEQQLGKKKLAYPIKKTRNGFYVVLKFDLDTKKIHELDAKIRSQTASIIRYLIVNLDEHIARSEKDKAAQARIPKREPVAEEEPEKQVEEKAKPAKVKEVKEEEEKFESPTIELSESELDKKIEEALSESIK